MNDKTFPKTIFGIKRFVKKECKALSESSRTFADFYRIIFSREMTMAETACGEEIQVYTYPWAKEQIEWIANGIAKKIGTTDQFVALSGKNCVEWLLLFWAILRSGNKPYLVNLMQPESLTDSILETLQVEYVLTPEDCAALAEAGRQGEQVLDAELFGNEIALTTSGTTLNEKICIYGGAELAAQVLNAEQALRWNKNIGRLYNGRLKMFAVLPFYHIFGLEASYLWLTFFGATMVFPENMVPETLLRSIRLHQVTHIFAVPLLWHTVEKTVRKEIAQRDKETQEKFETGLRLSLKLQNIWPRLGVKLATHLFAEVREKTFGDSVQFCISGGSPLKESTLELLNGLGYILLNGYGMSEIGIAAANFSHKPKDRIEGASIGIPFSSAEFRVDETGRLFVKGASVCKKIMVNKQVEEQAEWFDTGDIVRVDEDGKYYIQGRASDIVLGANGENLNPDFAEKAFVLPLAKNFSVLGDANNEKLMLIVQISPEITKEEKEILLRDIAACESTLPASYAIGQIWFTTDALMGEEEIKISRAKVKRAIAQGDMHLFASVDEIKADDPANDSPLKKQLRGIFASVLGVPEEEITNTGHFMRDLGGTSLDYFTLISEIGMTFGITANFGAGDLENFSYSLNDFEKIIEEALKNNVL